MIQTMRRAFTMIELIIVIVVMGIVGKYGIEIMIQAYDYYIANTADNRFQWQSQATVEQIANRLSYRVPGSEIVRLDTLPGVFNSPANLAGNVAVDNANVTVLEWVGIDIDGWRGDGTSTNPTWSGFIDIEATKANGNALVLNSSESNVTRMVNVWNALSPSALNGSTGYGLFFVQDANFNVQDGFAWDGVALTSQTTTAHRVDLLNDNNITAKVGTFSGQNIYEFYKLSWTAYALVYNKSARTLTLHYDYRPWNGQTYTNGTSVLLSEDVDTFRFRSAGDALKIQVCIQDIDITQEFAVCKEKTVF